LEIQTYLDVINHFRNLHRYSYILPFKESQARGVLQDNMANSYNGEDFENGLLHLRTYLDVINHFRNLHRYSY
jgi:protein involved in sex pheromone biosynthesis